MCTARLWSVRAECEHMFVRSKRDVAQVLALVSEGHADTVIARITGIPRSTIREWRIGRVPGATTVTGLDGRVRACPICIPGSIELPPAAYAYLFGLYSVTAVSQRRLVPIACGSFLTRRTPESWSLVARHWKQSDVGNTPLPGP